MNHYRITIDIDIVTNDKNDASDKAIELCFKIEKQNPELVKEALLDAIRERRPL